VPVLFGLNYRGFAEAVELVELGAAQAIGDTSTLVQMVEGLYADEASCVHKGEVAKAYVQSRAGATALILKNCSIN
jgi:3-deoxy-D-manno-octulosonic-acid transferase